MKNVSPMQMSMNDLCNGEICSSPPRYVELNAMLILDATIFKPVPRSQQCEVPIESVWASALDAVLNKIVRRLSFSNLL